MVVTDSHKLIVVIKQQMDAKGYSQYRLAKNIGINRSIIKRNFENPDVMSQSTLFSILKELDLTLNVS